MELARTAEAAPAEEGVLAMIVEGGGLGMARELSGPADDIGEIEAELEALRRSLEEEPGDDTAKMVAVAERAAEGSSEGHAMHTRYIVVQAPTGVQLAETAEPPSESQPAASGGKQRRKGREARQWMLAEEEEMALAVAESRAYSESLVDARMAEERRRRAAVKRDEELRAALRRSEREARQRAAGKRKPPKAWLRMPPRDLNGWDYVAEARAKMARIFGSEWRECVEANLALSRERLGYT